MTLTPKQSKTFQKELNRWFAKNQRSFPWRIPALGLKKDGSVDPYRIMVSEIMLQQTQATRVAPKFTEFMQVFPTIEKLAEARLSEVLREWQGLGYNRRAKALHEAAKHIVSHYDGKVPQTQAELEVLPGIGPYTAGAIQAFAFNQPVVFIETNIRTVFFHHFFQDREQVSDGEVLELVRQTLDMKNPRRWYTALMDYGAHLKAQGVRVNNKSSQYTKQSTFRGSDRQIRGAIIRALSDKNLSTKKVYVELPSFEPERIAAQLKKLKQEGLVMQKNQTWSLGA